jgi:hypothetical protein
MSGLIYNGFRADNQVAIMRTKASVIVVTAVLLSLGAMAVPVSAQSLADVARKEQDRRKAIKKPAKLLTNKDLGVPGSTAGSGATPPATGTAPAGAPGSTDGDKSKTAAPGAEKKADGSAKDQAYWSGRAKGLQTQLDRDQTFAVAMQSRINALTTQYTNQADPVQQAALASDRQKSVAELNRLTKQIDDDKKAIADLQEDARRAGVPSGWLR